MKNKYFYILRAIPLGMISLILFVLPFLVENSDNGLAYPLVILGAIISGYLTYKAIKKITESGIVTMNSYAPPKDATTKDQIKFYWRWILISLFIFPLLSLIVYWDLNDLESGTVERVNLWFPIAFLYKQFGYLTAVLSGLALGLLCILGFGRKIYLIKKQNTN